MKHWAELTELESEIIRVGEFKNLFKLLVAGAENDVDMKVVQSAIYTLEGIIDDIDSTLYEKFETVFNAVRGESQPETKITINPKDTMYGYSSETYPPTTYTISPLIDKTTDEEEEAFRNLDKALRSWHQKTV
jgi:hypothetical protein